MNCSMDVLSYAKSRDFSLMGVATNGSFNEINVTKYLFF